MINRRLYISVLITGILAFLAVQSVVGQDLFGPQQVISTNADGALFVYAADLDGDGNKDILSAANYADKIVWYNNDGEGNFSDQRIITSDVNDPREVFAADLDRDGDQDVILASDELQWYENDGSGNFNLQQTINPNSWGGVGSIYVADIDGDGDLDIVSSDFESVSWHENDGNGDLNEYYNITNAVDGVWSVHAADLDGDGDIDVLSASRNDDKIAWYENKGNGDFEDQHVITKNAKNAQSIYAADIDGDSSQDVITASADDNKVAWHKNDGSGNFSDPKIVDIEAEFANSVYAEDLDSDGDLDIISASGGSGIAWYQNNFGTFETKHIINDDLRGGGSIYAADLDGDGYHDILSASETEVNVSWYENTMPTPPSNLAALVENEQIRLDWDSNLESNISGYHIYRDIVSIDSILGRTAYHPFSSIDGTSYQFTDTKIGYDTTYYYRITAVDTSGFESGFSNQVKSRISSYPTLQLLQSNPIFLTKYKTKRRILLQFSHLLDNTTIGNGTGGVQLRGTINGENIPFNFNLVSKGTGLEIIPNSGFYATETVTVKVLSGDEGLKTKNGKYFDGNQNGKVEDPATDSLHFSFQIAPLGDFNADSTVDFEDLTKLRSVWANDYDYELGPVEGQFPALRVRPDSVFNGYDLITFVRYWNWSQTGTSKYLANATKQKSKTANTKNNPGDSRKIPEFGLQEALASYEANTPEERPPFKQDVFDLKNTWKADSGSGSASKYITVHTGRSGSKYQSIRKDNSTPSVTSELELNYPDTAIGLQLMIEYDPATTKLKKIRNNNVFDHINGGQTVFLSHIDSLNGLAMINAVNFGTLGPIDRASLASLEFETNGKVKDFSIGYDIRSTNGSQERAWHRAEQAFGKGIPETIKLEQNYPNPFNPQTTIQFQIPQQSKVRMQVYNTLGRRVATLIDKEVNSGYYKLQWNAAQHLASGVYFYILDVTSSSDSNHHREVKKMLLLK